MSRHDQLELLKILSKSPNNVKKYMNGTLDLMQTNDIAQIVKDAQTLYQKDTGIVFRMSGQNVKIIKDIFLKNVQGYLHFYIRGDCIILIDDIHQQCLQQNAVMFQNQNGYEIIYNRLPTTKKYQVFVCKKKRLLDDLKLFNNSNQIEFQFTIYHDDNNILSLLKLKTQQITTQSPIPSQIDVCNNNILMIFKKSLKNIQEHILIQNNQRQMFNHNKVPIIQLQYTRNNQQITVTRDNFSWDQQVITLVQNKQDNFTKNIQLNDVIQLNGQVNNIRLLMTEDVNILQYELQNGTVYQIFSNVN